jgi:pyruvate/2-oxoglutarate dehydrogenase complex dihydrolipoamide dehydrogenase (E3) component
MSEKRRATTRADGDSYDLLVLGSGAAGLSVVLRALELNPKLKIAVSQERQLGSTAQAQGGIAARLATSSVGCRISRRRLRFRRGMRPGVIDSDEEVVVAHNRDELRRLCGTTSA